MKITFISALCLMSFACFAQNKIGSSVQSKSSGSTKSNRSVYFGIKAGVNISNVEDKATANTTTLVGYHAGILAHCHLSTNLAVQPEVLFSSQGAQYPNFGKEKLNYLNVPVLLQYMFDQGVRVETGPQVGFVTSAKLERSSGGTTDIKYQLKNADFGWVIGLGYLSTAGLGIDARYNLGLTNISKDNQFNVKNRVWQFGLFYQFK